jgi:hypothetical protein
VQGHHAPSRNEGSKKRAHHGSVAQSSTHISLILPSSLENLPPHKLLKFKLASYLEVDASTACALIRDTAFYLPSTAIFADIPSFLANYEFWDHFYKWEAALDVDSSDPLMSNVAFSWKYVCACHDDHDPGSVY